MLHRVAVVRTDVSEEPGQVPLKRRFLQEPHGVTFQKTPFSSSFCLDVDKIPNSLIGIGVHLWPISRNRFRISPETLSCLRETPLEKSDKCYSTRAFGTAFLFLQLLSKIVNFWTSEPIENCMLANEELHSMYEQVDRCMKCNKFNRSKAILEIILTFETWSAERFFSICRRH
jgi:hypothetical protein